MQPTDLAPRSFSTVGLPAARRVELWETHNATALIGLDVQASEPLVATELNVRLPHVDLARVSGSAHVVRRTEQVIDRSPADALAVYMTLRGDAWFESPSGTYALQPGKHSRLRDGPAIRARIQARPRGTRRQGGPRGTARGTSAQHAGNRVLPQPRPYRPLRADAGQKCLPGHAN